MKHLVIGLIIGSTSSLGAASLYIRAEANAIRSEANACRLEYEQTRDIDSAISCLTPVDQRARRLAKLVFGE